MQIFSLVDYKKEYNIKNFDESQMKWTYSWNAQKFVDDIPVTDDYDIDAQLNVLRSKLKDELEKQIVNIYSIRQIEGEVYILLKNYFSSDSFKEHNKNLVAVNDKFVPKNNRFKKKGYGRRY